jgi:multidrug transporter EmrE-like cation transporter
MPIFAVFLVVVAAFTHASWNLLAKRAADCRHFNWYYSAGAVLLWMPLAAFAGRGFAAQASHAAIAALAATAVLHALYSATLMRGYRAADLSIVYPVARGTGPLLSFVGAVIVLKEHPSALAAAGALLVVAGVLVLAGGRSLWRQLRASSTSPAHDRVIAGLVWGGLTGVMIAAYTLNDGYAVRVLMISPILLDYAGNVFRAVIFAPRIWVDRAQVRSEYPRYWKSALGVSVLGPLGYILVLQAMMLAAALIVAGVLALALG